MRAFFVLLSALPWAIIFHTTEAAVNGPNDFAFVSDVEQVGYISAEVSSTIKFEPESTDPVPILSLYLPDGIELVSADSSWSISNWGYKPTIIDDAITEWLGDGTDRIKFTNNYLVKPKNDSSGNPLTPSKLDLMWKADPNHPNFSGLQDGGRLIGFYAGRDPVDLYNGSKSQGYQPLKIEFEVPVVTPRPTPAPTRNPTIDTGSGPNDFAFVSNTELVGYISAETSSMIKFEPESTDPVPILSLYLPNGIELVSADSSWSISNWGYKPTIIDEAITEWLGDGTDRITFENNYLITPNNDGNGNPLTPSKLDLFWKADFNHPNFSDLQDGGRLIGFYGGRDPNELYNGSKAQGYQPLKIEFQASEATPSPTPSPTRAPTVEEDSGPNDFSFVSNTEQVGYISSEVSSTIMFEPTSTDPVPILSLYLPDGIELLGAGSSWSISNWGYNPTIIDDAIMEWLGDGTDRITFDNNYLITPNNDGSGNPLTPSKLDLIWRADPNHINFSGLQDEGRLIGFYGGRDPNELYNGSKAQGYQPLKIEFQASEATPSPTPSPTRAPTVEEDSGPNDFSFVSNTEQVGYISSEVSSTIMFEPTSTDPVPILSLYLPDGIELLGAGSSWSISNWGYKPTIIDVAITEWLGDGTDRITFDNNYLITPNTDGSGNPLTPSKLDLIWKADPNHPNFSGLQDEGRLIGFYGGRDPNVLYNGSKAQGYQPLKIEFQGSGATPAPGPVPSQPPIGTAQRFMPGLPTDSSILHGGSIDFSFVSNTEQVGYISSEVSSMIHFEPGSTSPVPLLSLYLPDGIELLGAHKYWAVSSWGYNPTISDDAITDWLGGDSDSMTFTNNYFVEPKLDDNGNPRTPDKFILFWKADPNHPNFSTLQNGGRLIGFYGGRDPNNPYGGSNAQRYQPLKIEIVQVPEATPFENVPVYLSLASDLVDDWSDYDSLAWIGLNDMEIWSYVYNVGHANQWNRGPYSAARYGNSVQVASVRDSLASVGIDTTVWPGGKEWWELAATFHQKNGQADNLARLDGIDGPTSLSGRSWIKLTYNDDYSGPAKDNYFSSWLEMGKFFTAQGFSTHGFDPEIYVGQAPGLPPGTPENKRGFGWRLDHNPDTVAAFQDWYNGLSNAEIDVFLQELMDVYDEAPGIVPAYVPDPEEITDSSEDRFFKRVWDAFKAERYAFFFADYREAVEAYAGEPITMRIMTTYHRFWQSFGSEQFIEHPWTSPVYTNTFEDPRLLAQIFDYLHPMVYMDIYANGADYDMKLPFDDVYGLRMIASANARVAPLLSAGYCYIPGFEADTSAEMLKSNILESFIAGGYGFGIWGVTRIDAKDMQVIAQVVSALSPYEDIIENGTPTAEAAVTGDAAFVNVLNGGSNRGSLVLVSEYSEDLKFGSVIMDADSDAVVCDVFDGVPVSTTAVAAGRVQFDFDLQGKDRNRMYYVGNSRGTC